MSKKKLVEVSNFTPKPHQPEAIVKLLKNRYHILADDMGLGKTFEFLASCLILQKRSVIVCPAYLKGVWNKEIIAVCKNIEDRDLFRVTSYSRAKNLLELLEEHQAEVIGFDEAHYLKNMKAQRTINSFQALSDYGMDRICLMSGTPIKNRIPEWYALLRLIHWHKQTSFLDKFPTEWSFSVYFCKERSFKIKTKKGFRRVTQFYGLRESRRAELLSWVRPIMTRRMAHKVLDLKKPEFIFIDADITKQYDEDLVEAFKSGKDSSAKRKSALSKVPFTAKFVTDILEQTDQTVVWTCHPEVATQLSEKFKECEVITGATPVDNRQPIVDRFQSGKTKILFCTIGAASAGYTMTAAHVAVFNDMSYVAGDNDQAVRRQSRIGQTKPCRVYCIGGSQKDNDINKSLKEKIKDLERGM